MNRTAARKNSIAWLFLVLAVVACGQSTKPSATVRKPSPSPTAAPTPTPSPTPRVGRFVAATSMTTVRSDATATLLSDGRVLIAGGTAKGKPLATAEIYDSRTGAFTATGSMSEPRAGHTATLLSDGRVLIAGGSGDKSVEIYNPGTEKFSRTDSMFNSPIFQTTTLLNDGRVLIAGGGNGGGYSSRGQTYNPSRGRWSGTRPLNDARENATATTLQDGRVLIAGGDRGITGPNPLVLASAEIFNPSTGQFTQTGSMADPRSHFTATLLLNGRVLVVGGDSLTSTTGLLATAEIYDPGTGKWTATGSMTFGRSDFTATLLSDGRVLIAGCGDNSAELYSPATGTFRMAAPMLLPRELQTATLLKDSRVLIAGGNDSKLAELYLP
jgi:hypothetical protein